MDTDQSGIKGCFGTDGVSTKFVWYDRFVYQYNCGTGILVFHSAIYDVSLYTCSVFVKRLQADFGLYDSDGLLAYSVYPVCCTFFGISFNGNIQFPVAGGYLLYVILGYLLSTTDMSKKTRMFLCILGATGAGIRYISTVAWSTNSSGLNHAFWGYLSFPTVFLAVGVFVAVKYGPWKKLEQNPGIRRAVTTLASTGLGVYVTHMLVLQTLQNLTKLGTESGWWRFVMPFVIYVISVMSVLILKKIPVFRAIVP